MKRFGFRISYVLCHCFYSVALDLSPGLVFSRVRFSCLGLLDRCRVVRIGLCWFLFCAWGSLPRVSSSRESSPSAWIRSPFFISACRCRSARQGRTFAKDFCCRRVVRVPPPVEICKIRHRRPGALSACYCFTVLIYGQISSFCEPCAPSIFCKGVRGLRAGSNYEFCCLRFEFHSASGKSSSRLFLALPPSARSAS
jgi:hypothetical protein